MSPAPLYHGRVRARAGRGRCRARRSRLLIDTHLFFRRRARVCERELWICGRDFLGLFSSMDETAAREKETPVSPSLLALISLTRGRTDPPLPPHPASNAHARTEQPCREMKLENNLTKPTPLSLFSLFSSSIRGRSVLRYEVQDVHRVPRGRGDELRRQHRRQEPLRHIRQALGEPPQPPPRRLHRRDGHGYGKGALAAYKLRESSRDPHSL
jgi:hypothetical protein